MIYVGVDIAKLNHFAAAISATGETLVEPFKFTNDNDGFCKFVSVLTYIPGNLTLGTSNTTLRS